MKYNFLLKSYRLTIFFLYANSAFSQLRDNTWIMGYPGFGSQYGLSKLTFESGTLKLDTAKSMGFDYNHNNSAISDEQGNFIASFTGIHIMNKKYELMENGYKMDKEVIKYEYYLSSDVITQGSVMLPWPGHPDSILIPNSAKEIGNS